MLQEFKLMKEKKYEKMKKAKKIQISRLTRALDSGDLA